MKSKIFIGMILGMMGLFSREALNSLTKMKMMALWPAEEIEFKEVAPGAKRAVLWGDPQKGAFGGIAKFAPGTVHELHLHSSDVKLVVISGMLIYKVDGKEHKLGAGSYLLIPGGRKHSGWAGKESELVFFEEWSGKFDMQMIDEKKPISMEMSKTREIILPAEKMNYNELRPGIKQAVLSGDPAKGEYTAITKFDPGLKFALHYHTADKKAVLLSGKMAIGDVNGEKTIVEKGSFGMMPAGMIHSTEIGAGEGAVMFEISSGKAETILVGEKPEQKK